MGTAGRVMPRRSTVNASPRNIQYVEAGFHSQGGRPVMSTVFVRNRRSGTVDEECVSAVLGLARELGHKAYFDEARRFLHLDSCLHDQRVLLQVPRRLTAAGEGGEGEARDPVGRLALALESGGAKVDTIVGSAAAVPDGNTNAAVVIGTRRVDDERSLGWTASYSLHRVLASMRLAGKVGRSVAESTNLPGRTRLLPVMHSLIEGDGGSYLSAVDCGPVIRLELNHRRNAPIPWRLWLDCVRGIFVGLVAHLAPPHTAPGQSYWAELEAAEEAAASPSGNGKMTTASFPGFPYSYAPIHGLELTPRDREFLRSTTQAPGEAPGEGGPAEEKAVERSTDTSAAPNPSSIPVGGGSDEYDSGVLVQYRAIPTRSGGTITPAASAVRGHETGTRRG